MEQSIKREDESVGDQDPKRTTRAEIQAAPYARPDSVHNLGVTIGQPATVNATLAPGAVNESIVVSGTVEQVQTSTSGNIGNLVDNAALQTLPIVTSRGRNPLSLVELEPGVVDGSGFNQGGVNIAGGGVYVNGARDRAWNYTLDGVDINETSAGGSNFSPLRTNPDMLSEFRVITSNATAEYGRNSGAEVEMVTRSGTNQYHGSGYFFYQTPGFNANDPANIEAGLSRPQFIQKIPGFTFGGPIIKNKTFFFVNFQWLRTLSTTITTNTVYTNAARQGTLRYVDQASTICPQLAALGYACANAPAGSSASTVDSSGNPLPGVTLDSYDVVSHDPLHLLDPNVQSVLNSMPSPNNFSVGDGVNIAGFTWLGAEHEKQLDYTVRVDHTFNQAHSLFVRWSAGHQNTLGDTVNAGLPIFPGFPNVVDTFRTPKNLAVSWRWVMNPRLLNEVVVGVSRFGFNFANPDPQFRSNPAFNFFAHPLCGYFNNLYCMQVPLQNYVGNARFLTTYQLLDNMSYLHGAHAFKWGLNLRYQRHIDQRGSIGALNAALAINFDPGVNSDFSAFSVPSTGTSSGDIDSGDLDNLEGSINDLVGRVGLIQQGYVAKSPTAWQPAGTLLHADFRLPEYDFYGQDTWRVRPNLVVDLGLRWEIKLSPRVTNPDNMLRPNPPLGWRFSSDNLTWVPGQLYRDAFKNFGPSIGFAWDPGSNGKTSIRGNFRIAYDRINTFSLSSAVFQGMPGITTEITNKSFGTSGGRLSQLTPALLNQLIDPNEVGTPADLRTPPPFSTNTNTAVDPNWTPPQTYMWSFGIQHELPYKMVLESNYVGRKGIHLFGAYDANQVKYRKNGFLQSFKTVAAGGDSPLIDQLLGADPNKPSSETGSQWMRDPNSPWSSDLQAGLVADEAASLAFPVLDSSGVGHNLPAESGLGSTFFYSYPQFAGDFIDGNPGGFVIFDSHDFSTYNALQTQVRRAFANGFTFQASYTWSKSIDTRSFDPTFTQVATASSPFGASSTPFDLDNRRLNYAPSDFDRTHSFQSIWVFELPFGKGKRWGNSWNGFLDRVIGGWEIGGFGIIQSGRPTTIYAPDYSFGNVVRTVASCDGCSPDMFQIHRDPTTGLLTYVTPEQKNKFSTPIFGEFSNVGRNFFRLAGYKNLSMSLAKKFRITEHQEFETRLEVQNVTNSVHYDEPAANRFTRGDFGKVDPLTVVDDGRGLSSDPRKMQVSVRYTF